MKLDNLAITYNEHSFEWLGIPPQSFGGKVKFKDESGNETNINLSASAVDQIMQTVAVEVANNAQRMLSQLSLKTIRDSARPLAIQVDPAIEEGDFQENYNEIS